MARKYFDTKDPDETINLTFDFTDFLGAADRLTGTPVVAVTVDRGTDALPSAMLNGPAALADDARKIVQSVKGGVANADYRFEVRCATTGGTPEQLPVLVGYLPVRE